MGISVENCRMYDTVSETPFGPLCHSDEEAEQLISHILRTRDTDPRVMEPVDRLLCFVELIQGEKVPTHPDRLCQCGSGLQYSSKTWSMHDVKTHCEKCQPRAKYLTGK